MKSIEADLNLRGQILDFCRHIAGTAEITAVTLFDYCTVETKRSRGAMEAVLVIHDFPPRIMSYVKVIGEKTVVVVAVDQWVFERDIDRGFLGEASASTLVFPYVVLSGELYLHVQEILLKKRLILEILENLALSFPELSTQLQIRPEYFMYEVLLNRVRVFPPLAESVSNFMRDMECEKSNPMLDSYVEALSQLEREKRVKVSDGYVTIPKKIVSESKKPKVWLSNISRNAPRTLFTPVFKVFPHLLNIFSQTTETFPKFQTYAQWRKNLDAARTFVNPEKYVFVPTAKGLVSLADRLDIDAYVRKTLLRGKSGKVKLEPVGGVLNDVYLIKTDSLGEEKRVLVKRFKDWSGFKWFPLNLWSLGARTFAVLGKSRLEKECATSELLRDKGFNVPKVLHVSHSKRLIFMEFLDGENVANTIKRMANSNATAREKDLETVSKVGEIMAKVHALNVALGDTKPENAIVSKGEIYLLDFEQASRGGDKSWDVAEFLYYSGHYLPPLHSNLTASAIAKAFIKGYIEGGGSLAVVKKAGAPKYTRVFSIFTAPSVLAAMAAACRKAEMPR